VDDGDIARKQVRQLPEKKGRAQLRHQRLIETCCRIGSAGHSLQHGGIDRHVAFAAEAGHHHVRSRQARGVLSQSRGFQREAGRIGADALALRHLALVGFLRDLLVEYDGRQRMI
jgi:hypothetical protein